MSPAGTFERVYTALRDKLTSGAFRPGDPLEPRVLGLELNASVTPVRDALHRLTGEGLVAATRNGFEAPSLTEAMLRDLYGWSETLLVIAAREAGPISPPIQTQMTPEVADLFEALATASPNIELQRALAACIDRLAPFRVEEARLLDDIEEEVRQMIAAGAADDRPLLVRLLRRYHRRRCHEVPRLLAARHRRG